MVHTDLYAFTLTNIAVKTNGTRAGVDTGHGQSRYSKYQSLNSG